MLDCGTRSSAAWSSSRCEAALALLFGIIVVAGQACVEGVLNISPKCHMGFIEGLPIGPHARLNLQLLHNVSLLRTKLALDPRSENETN